jgi:anti-anti-sigma factor
MKIEVIHKKDIANIVISGDLTVGNILDIKKHITEHQINASTVSLSIKNNAFIDLSGIQLIYSIRKAVKKQGKQFVYTIDTQTDTSKLLSNAGFSIKKDI